MNVEAASPVAYDRIQRCRQIEDVLPLLRAACNGFGYEDFVFWVRAPIVNRPPAFYVLSSLPESFFRMYEAERWIRDDPVLRAGWCSLRPIDWRALDWTRSAGARRLREALLTLDRADGVSVPLRGPVFQSGAMSLVRRALPAAPPAPRALLDRIRAVATDLFDRVIELPVLQQVRGGIGQLTEREAEFLRLRALGHPLKKIHSLMQIKQSTATYFTGRIVAKLGVRRLHSAVNQAQLNGIVDLVGYPDRIVGTPAWMPEKPATVVGEPVEARALVYVRTPWVHAAASGSDDGAESG